MAAPSLMAPVPTTAVPVVPVVPITATSLSHPPSLVLTSEHDLFRNELWIGVGIVCLGGLIGLLVGMYRNQSLKQSGFAYVESEAKAAFWGFLVGFIIALASVLIYRSYFHTKFIAAKARSNP